MSYFDFSQVVRKKAGQSISTLRSKDGPSDLYPTTPVTVDGRQYQIMDYQMIGKHLDLHNLYSHDMVIFRQNGNASAWSTYGLTDEFEIQGMQDYFITDCILEVTWANVTATTQVLPEQFLCSVDTYFNNSTLVHSVQPVNAFVLDNIDRDNTIMSVVGAAAGGFEGVTSTWTAQSAFGIGSSNIRYHKLQMPFSPSNPLYLGFLKNVLIKIRYNGSTNFMVAGTASNLTVSNMRLLVSRKQISPEEALYLNQIPLQLPLKQRFHNHNAFQQSQNLSASTRYPISLTSIRGISAGLTICVRKTTVAASSAALTFYDVIDSIQLKDKNNRSLTNSQDISMKYLRYEEANTTYPSAFLNTVGGVYQINFTPGGPTSLEDDSDRVLGMMYLDSPLMEVVTNASADGSSYTIDVFSTNFVDVTYNADRSIIFTE